MVQNGMLSFCSSVNLVKYYGGDPDALLSENTEEYFKECRPLICH